MASLCVLERIILSVLCTLARRVMHHLSQSQRFIIHDPLLCAYASEKGCQEPSESVAMHHFGWPAEGGHKIGESGGNIKLRNASTHHNLPGRPPAPSAPPQIGRAGGRPTSHIRKGEPLHLEDTTVHLGVTEATRHHHITLPSKLEERLARLPKIARGDLLSTQGLAYFMEAVLNAAIGYQALALPRPQDALRHARQQVTKAWAQHGGWPTSFPKEAMMAHWRYYGDNTGALVDMAYAKHAAHLLHRVTHNHQPEVREAAAIRIKEAQMARNTCPRWILAQHGVSTPVGTGIWAQLQLLLPHHTHAIITNHHCDQQGPLVATHTDIHRRPAGELDTLRLVGTTITIM